MVNTYNLSKISNQILQQEINKVDFEDLFENTDYDLKNVKVEANKSLIKNI